MISQENKIILIKRAKSLGWRLLMMVTAGLVAFATENLNLFVMPEYAQLILGLILGEISKYINSVK